ncbi:uncharacterized protein LOC127447468 [Myxocyprinus asiaticus]|uniref:uncharacterized protein LOC127447468 n=1 Tax=Myxocyprinus asiaticus TaxID=70543 RepID=UPI00222392F1|nr:uncharacterized protein LOC127447468 [Myxocyprinus asiaticus]
MSNSRGYVNMMDKFTLLTLCFSLILQYVCCSVKSFNVSEPLNHTLNEDGSVSVICMFDGPGVEWDAKLKMNNENICELYQKEDQTEYKMCDWDLKDNKFKFTLKKLEARHKDQLFSCEISRTLPLPISTNKGVKTKLFPGVNIPFPLPRSNCSSTGSTAEPMNDKSTDIQYILILGLIVVVLLLSLYSIIITNIYIRLKVTKFESSDTLTYVPMQRKVKRCDLENTEYVDMRKVQKQRGSIRDMNHSSHPVGAK